MKNIVVLGLGDSFWADSGFGKRAVEALHARYIFPRNVTLIDGGTEGEAFLPLIEDADVLLIVDAVDFNLAPGAIKQLDGAAVARQLRGCENWLHQVSIVDALDTARSEGRLPARIRLIGVQPLELENYGADLCAEAKQQVDKAVVEMVGFLASIGITAAPRPANLPAEPLARAEMDLAVFEPGNFA